MKFEEQLHFYMSLLYWDVDMRYGGKRSKITPCNQIRRQERLELRFLREIKRSYDKKESWYE